MTNINKNEQQTQGEKSSSPPHVELDNQFEEAGAAMGKQAREAVDDAKSGLKDMKEDYKDMPSDAKKATAKISEEGRSWVADKLEETADSVKPESEKEKEREENKTFLDKTQDKVYGLTSSLQDKVEQGQYVMVSGLTSSLQDKVEQGRSYVTGGGDDGKNKDRKE